MGGLIVGVAIAIVIFLIVKLGSSFKSKRNNNKNDNAVIDISKENTTEQEKVEKGD